MTLNEIAAKYIGITEKPNNGGFSDPEFEARMKKDGEWQKGWAWCCCCVQLCVMEWLSTMPILPNTLHEIAKRNGLYSVLDKAITPSVKGTFDNLLALGFILYKEPKVGDLVIWLTFKNDKPTGTGHVGIANQVTLNNLMYPFTSVEGNTNAKGEREGNCVAERERGYLWNTKNGLRLMGFVRLEDRL